MDRSTNRVTIFSDRETLSYKEGTPSAQTTGKGLENPTNLYVTNS